MSFRCTQLVANIEIDFEELFETVIEEYEIENIDDLRMDDVIEYIDNHISFLKGKNTSCISEVSDGGSINGFEEREYQKIDEMLETFKNERR